MSKRVPNLLKLATLLAAATAATFADTITFENQCPSGQTASGPCSALYSTVGNAQTLNFPTSIGSVAIGGGSLFDNIANLPSDETAVYGTAGNASNIGVFPGSGFTNPLTITFPEAVTSFSLDILNGNTTTVKYQLADNLGNSADFQISPNFSGGLQSVGFAATGSKVTISAVTGQNTTSGMTWDFLIDNINFTTAQTPTSSAPEPGTALLLGIGLIALGLARHPPRFSKRVSVNARNVPLGIFLVLLFGNVLVVPSASAATVALSCPSPNGAVGVAYSSALKASGGVPPYTFSISSGGLPGGLTLNVTTGAITGIPLGPDTTTFTAKAVDSLIPGAGGSPDSATAACIINIASPITPPPPPPSTGTHCTSEDVTNLLHKVPVSSTSHIYVAGAYSAGALMVEDTHDTADPSAPPPVTLQVSSPGALGSFCVYWIDDKLVTGAPLTYHFPTIKFDHPVRFAWTQQGDPTQFGVANANNTVTVHPYGGATPVPWVLTSDAIVGSVGVSFGSGDFAAEPSTSLKAAAEQQIHGMLRARQQPAAACLSIALVIDGGDKTSWLSSGIASAAAADGDLMNTWLAGRGFTVTRISQYGPNPARAYANGTERASLLGDIGGFSTQFNRTPTAANCHHEFFLYISSHGRAAAIVNGQFVRPAVSLYDGDGSGTRQSVSYRDIYDELDQFPTDARHRTTVYTMVDACYSGSSIAIAQLRYPVNPANPGHWALQVICSSDSTHTSAAGHGLISSSATEDFMKDSTSITTGFGKMVDDLGAENPVRLRRPDRADATLFTLDP